MSLASPLSLSFSNSALIINPSLPPSDFGLPQSQVIPVKPEILLRVRHGWGRVRCCLGCHSPITSQVHQFFDRRGYFHFPDRIYFSTVCSSRRRWLDAFQVALHRNLCCMIFQFKPLWKLPSVKIVDQRRTGFVSCKTMRKYGADNNWMMAPHP